MAFVSELDRLTRDSQKRHGGIRGTYFTFEQDGIRYLQIDTRGSGERQEKGKTSQTIQIGPEIARLLLPELQRVAASDGGAATPFSGHDSAGKPADVSKLRGSASRFETALQLAGYNWRTDLVRAFVAALLAKRFVVLAGVTGSGKSRLALALGEWLGEGRSLMVSVRPDWTGPEAILGFEDLLSRDGNGSRPWQVPDVLAFMAKAARTPAEPFLLILDEMNLAHVERYFADVLSGMESGVPCLPKVEHNDDGRWVMAKDEEKIPVPSNLFIVGTVNVDETTYMFSPKVLDRSFTIEFRVSAEELAEEARKPAPVAAGNSDDIEAFLDGARDESFQAMNPVRNRKWLVGRLRRLHGTLANTGFEFGHRTFYEALRFAALSSAIEGDADGSTEALDLILKLKILPRIHGSFRFLNGTLQDLGRFCIDPESNAEESTSSTEDVFESLQRDPKLPLSFEKLQRMNRVLRANQFVSFAEC